MPPLAHQLDYLSVDDYLAGERESEQKYEYVDGKAYAMAGASANHNFIAGNLYALIWNHQRGKSCFPMTSDMLVKTTAKRFRYPDLMVVCDDDPSQDTYVRESPILIVEVLSGSTHRKDKTEKRAEYLALPSLLEYVLIEQDIAEVVVQRRSEAWRSTYYYPGSTVTLESIGLTVPVEAIYERVDNADMRVFWAVGDEAS
ncbi:Uma2 family endonuclease [Thiothrix lacustris]|uniref:Uma2 family endonuclease n=1 Tax=Thiothrix lacustris TaxID=525917 RepID=UPI0027E51BE3|nr:Uma2 family endonuclease [Thiothrix lacustris]WMP16533.1 Uma2 family endonuclease [Thiothrix lacustris]